MGLCAPSLRSGDGFAAKALIQPPSLWSSCSGRSVKQLIEQAYIHDSDSGFGRDPFTAPFDLVSSIARHLDLKTPRFTGEELQVKFLSDSGENSLKY
jgi:hypothetical protein